jgi:ankyrin repeat protein
MGKDLLRLKPAILLGLVLAGVPAAAQDIIASATEGDLDRVRELTEDDPATVSAVDDRGTTALHFAVSAGHLDVADFLLDNGADLEARDVDGDTPLLWAAHAGQVAAIDFLLDRGAEINVRNHGQETPLLVAARRLKYAAVERLAVRGADLEIPNDYGRTPLIWTAREGGDLQMATLLLRLGADADAVDRFGASALELAAWRGFRTLVGILLDAGARFDVNPGMEQRLLHMAASEGLERLWTEVTASGATVDLNAQRLPVSVHLAASGGSARIVRDLLDLGARPDSTDQCGWTPLHHAADRGRADVAAALAAADPVVDRTTISGYTPLSLAQANGNPATVRALQEAGHSVFERDFPQLSGPWLGQGDPPATQEPFALDIVSSAWGLHGGVTFTPDGREAYWSGYLALPDSGYARGTILTTRLRDGRWTPPAPASFVDAEKRGDVPFVAPDGRRLFFLSTRPLAAGTAGGKENVWVVEREGDDWGEPRPLPPCVNDMHHHWQISVAANGNLYFSSNRSAPGTHGIYVSRPVDGEYTEPEFLGFPGGSPFIAPDESYLITETGYGRDNVLRVRRDDGTWSDPVSVREFHPVAGPCPRVSPDGRAYFVLGDADYWVAADFLEEWQRLASLSGAAPALERAAREGGAVAVGDLIAAIREAPQEWYVSESGLNALGYRLMSDGLLDEAIAVLSFNVRLYPDSANTHDSLGEAYLNAGRDEEAIASYRRSLELDPRNANAEAMLERLGAGDR